MRFSLADMKRGCLALLIFAETAALCFAAGEKKIVLGGSADWDNIAVLDGVAQTEGLRPYPVLTLVDLKENSEMIDLALDFDEINPRRYHDAAGHYTVRATQQVNPASVRWAYGGSGAAVFDRSGKAFVSVKSSSPNALFSEGNRAGSFTIEFFLFPHIIDSGAEIFAWSAQKNAGKTQLVRASVVKNSISIVFDNFFTSSDNQNTIDLRLSSKKTLVPEKYSHHLIRFDDNTGLMEYLIDGILEDARYTTENGRENADFYEPFIGKMGELVIGKGFNGIIDEFYIHRTTISDKDIARNKERFGTQGGWAASRTFDLGAKNAEALEILAQGGYAKSGPSGFNSYTNTANVFGDSSALQFFIRAQDSPYGWESNDWKAIEPNKAIEGIKGRYVQLACAFYAGEGGGSSAYLEKLEFIYKRTEPLAPPSLLTAEPGDGFVTLRWSANPRPETSGYRVYIGTKSGEYWELPPIDAGAETSCRIDGLENGTLYYFVISSYDNEDIDGVFSREIKSRPLAVSRAALTRG